MAERFCSEDVNLTQVSRVIRERCGIEGRGEHVAYLCSVLGITPRKRVGMAGQARVISAVECERIVAFVAAGMMQRNHGQTPSYARS